MKKSLLFAFCAAILLCVNSASAQTSSLSSGSQLQGSGLVAQPMLGSEWSVTIIVTDIKSAPIAGALVSAPCTGLGSQYTNTLGNAVFTGSGSCPCNKSNINVTTAGCDKTVKVSCGNSQVICP